MNQLQSKTQLLQTVIWLIQTLKHGEINLQTNGKENIQITTDNNRINLNFLQKEQLRDLLELEPQMEKESILKKLENLKDLAERLKQQRFTFTIAHKGQTLLTLGSAAHPTISQTITGTTAIEINNLIELIKLTKIGMTSGTTKPSQPL